MKLLLDQNLSFKLVSSLEGAFSGSSHVRLLGLDQSDDLTIWDHAARFGFTLVTLDGDFAELLAMRGPPPKVVWLRCGNHPTRVIERLLLERTAELFLLENEQTLDCLEIG